VCYMYGVVVLVSLVECSGHRDRLVNRHPLCLRAVVRLGDGVVLGNCVRSNLSLVLCPGPVNGISNGVVVHGHTGEVHRFELCCCDVLGGCGVLGLGYVHLLLDYLGFGDNIRIINFSNGHHFNFRRSIVFRLNNAGINCLRQILRCRDSLYCGDEDLMRNHRIFGLWIAL